MSTRSLTIFYDDFKDKPFAAMYRQMDGYLSGHGKDLKEAFGDFVIVNGIGSNTPSAAANGMDCLAAQIVAHFKEGIGGIYLSTPQNKQEYNYHLHNRNGRLWVDVKTEHGKSIWSGWLFELPTEEEG